MKLANYKHPTRQDFPLLPPWFVDAMKGPGKQMQDLTDLLQGKASLPDNMNIEMKELTVRHGKTYTLGLTKLKGVPMAAWVGYSSQFEGTNFAWRNSGGQQVDVTFSWASAPPGDITVRVIFMGG